ncbi:MAG: site-specific integrase [Deltaproteobacteria bacterium]|nr:site-specific integrase [Deltaproteobacteria bacterium]
MSIYQKYKDKEGNHFGPWFVKYPYRRNKATGKIEYKIAKVGHSKKMAERVYAKKYEEYKMREHLDWEDTTPMTFNQLADWYVQLPTVQDLSCYNDIVRNCEYWKEFFGNTPITDIKPAMVEKYRIERLQQTSLRGKYFSKRKVAPASVNREVATLRRMFNLAIREDLASKNPCYKVEKLPENNERKRILSQDEFDLLLDELPIHAMDIVQTAYYTGMRAGEIYNLTWDKVGLEKGAIQLEARDTKTRKPRLIYLHKEVLGILSRLSQVRSTDHDYVFTYEGQPIKSIKNCFNKACRRAGIDDFRFHDLRHTFNTLMRKAGVSKSVIMQLTGHTTDAMFHRYDTVDEIDARDALVKFVDFIENSEEEDQVE